MNRNGKANASHRSGIFLATSAVLGAGLLLMASCASGPRAPPPPRSRQPPSSDTRLLAACKANYPTHGWQQSDPPEAALRQLFTVPRGTTTQLWFRGRDKAIAVCIPCGAGSAAVKSFEWYSPGFTQGELGLKNCSATAK